MPPLSTSASPAPAPAPASAKDVYSRLADAIYQWCLANHQPGKIFLQQELLNSNLIPNRDLTLLVRAADHLQKARLFRLHDVKGSAAVAWELVSQEDAANYEDLSRDEQMVYGLIHSAGTAGVWTKQIKAKTNLHTKVVEKAYKSLESKGLIKNMKDVKHPGRKMYILSKLRPNEEATGGSWYTNDELDITLMENVAEWIEFKVSARSWIELDAPETVEAGQKRKAPSDGFHEVKGKGRAKTIRIDEEWVDATAPDPPRLKSKSKTPKKVYKAHPAGYHGYLTASEITAIVNEHRVTTTILPQNAISQLLTVMVLDDKLVKLYRPPRPDNAIEEQEAADSENGQVTIYKTYKDTNKLREQFKRKREAVTGTIKAKRELELEDIGLGGATEVPCLRCPVFEICEDGGPVNAETCTYMDEFWQKMEEADKEAEDETVAPTEGDDDTVMEL